KAAEQLVELLTPAASPELSHGLLEALARSEAPNVGPALIKVSVSLTPTVRATALRVLLGRPQWTTLFLDAVEKGTLSLSDLSLDQKQSLSGHVNGKIAARAKALLARGGALPSPDRQKVIDELMPLTKKTGDPAAGKVVFKNHCAKCHVHSGEGAK